MKGFLEWLKEFFPPQCRTLEVFTVQKPDGSRNSYIVRDGSTGLKEIDLLMQEFEEMRKQAELELNEAADALRKASRW